MGGSKFLLLRRIKEAIVAGFAPDPSGGSPGDLIEVNATQDDYDFRSAPIEDPVLIKATDASILANSESFYYPEESDANQSTLESAGYTRVGGATNPATFQILDGALQVDIPGNHTQYLAPGVGIPLTVAENDPFDVIFIPEPHSLILPVTGQEDGQSWGPSFGVGNSSSGSLFTVYKRFESSSTRRIYYSNATGTFSTGAEGAMSNNTSVSMIDIAAMRFNRIGNNLYYSFLGAGHGWELCGKGSSPNPHLDRWLFLGSLAHTAAITHATFGITTNPLSEAHQIRLKAIWRLV